MVPKWRYFNERKVSHQKCYLIPLSFDDKERSFQDEGYAITHNPPGDGNCQFLSVSRFLRSIGYLASIAETLRQEVVDFLSVNTLNPERQPLELSAEIPWNDYLTDMSRSGVYGEHITLNVIATLYNIQITVVSSLGPAARAEGNGDHYVNLEFKEEVSDEEITNLVPSDNESMKNELNQQGVKNSVDFTIRQLVYCQPVDWNNLPDEIWVKIIRFALQNSDFSKENHICKMYKSLLNLNMRFSGIAQSCRDQLQYIVQTKICYQKKRTVTSLPVWYPWSMKSGSFSGIVFGAQENLFPEQEIEFRFAGACPRWIVLVYHPKHLLEK